MSGESDEDDDNVENEMEDMNANTHYGLADDADFSKKGSAFHEARRKRLKK